MSRENFDKLGEECGVFGIYDFDGNDVASTIYYGLFALQHRGQESCGIAVSDTNGPKRNVTSQKGMGLCNEVFTPDSLQALKGDIGVGHVRYSTAGERVPENAQPLVLNRTSRRIRKDRSHFPDNDRFRSYRISHRKRTREYIIN